MRRIDEQPLLLRIDQDVHILHGNGTQQDIGTKRQDHCPSGGPPVFEPNIHRTNDFHLLQATIGQFRCLSRQLSGDVQDELPTFWSLARISLGGLSHTSFTGFQFLVLPDQRSGFFALVAS
uniref:Uncharacterized protein n=1 Tax=Candidatus Kentrum sp. LPFa TaxID=2126335 RepID=A0A450XRS6_9GAMM|nr:MAG: hypothetical protein BECKLPF1236A_GA0070988_1013811 [Candidatus Kentron sp. LPFa]VFK31973.1 MAG: hypothetical protein BECKLPF1236C_GA0070990_1015310 [Candidatus Kentron sp. LPFa]